MCFLSFLMEANSKWQLIKVSVEITSWGAPPVVGGEYHYGNPSSSFINWTSSGLFLQKLSLCDWLSGNSLMLLKSFHLLGRAVYSQIFTDTAVVFREQSIWGDMSSISSSVLLWESISAQLRLRNTFPVWLCFWFTGCTETLFISSVFDIK